MPVTTLRNSTDPYDAIVVGAGPAGAACGHYLARAGCRVLILDRKTFPRDKCCGDGLTPHALRLLEQMNGPVPFSAAHRVAGVRVVHLEEGRSRTRDFAYRDAAGSLGHGLVIPRLELDDMILAGARREGADFMGQARVVDVLLCDGRVTGVIAEARGVREELHATYVVAADGATSRLAEASGMSARDRAEPGFAMRCYVDGIAGALDHQEIYLPLADPSGSYLLPSYGWVFPLGDGTANVGVGIFRKVPFDNVRSLYERFLALLMDRDPRFAGARAGAPTGAPLRFDFDPDQCSAPGLLLAGDAAGLTSPFSGEGISYALESGRLAAEAIARTLRRSPGAPGAESDYALLMGSAFAGYFEAGRRSAQRHQLVWHVLDSSFDNDRPLFSLMRRAALVPEAAGGSGIMLQDLSGALPKGDMLMRRQMLDIGAKLVGLVRRDWPIVGRLELARAPAKNPMFRPSLLMLLAARFGNPRAPGLVEMGAALDLVFMGLLAQSSVQEEGSGTACDGNWSNKFSILCGDYLISRGVELAASARSVDGDLVVGALERSCRGRIAQLKTATRLDIETDVALSNAMESFVSAFALPMEIGARLANVPDDTRAKLAQFATQLAAATILHDDLQSLTGDIADSIPLFATDLERGIAAVPILLSAHALHGRASIEAAWSHRPFDRARIAAAMTGTSGIQQTKRIIKVKCRKAYFSASTLPACPAKRSLQDLPRIITGSA